ncbi:MAG: lactonase family protein, partial [Salinisphaera sp.]|nr:lactonase family protein [Salinisphaera sp.]
MFGGRQPIANAEIVAYMAGASPGASATVIGTDTTDGSGVFNITFLPTPANGQIVYVVAIGGDSGSGSPNSAIRLMTIAGAYCDSSNADCDFPTFVNVNELSTVAATAALQDYIDFGACPSGAGPGSDCVLIPGALGLADAAVRVNNLVNVTTGQASDFLGGAASSSPQHATLLKLNTLADILLGCVNSAGPANPACTTLFSLTTSGTTTVTPDDTLEAAFNIAANPQVNARTRSLFTLLPVNQVFAPIMATNAAAGAYWTLGGQAWLYLAEEGENAIVRYRLTDAGNLAHAGTYTYSSGSAQRPNAFAVGPRGRFLYVADYTSVAVIGFVSGFAMTPGTGRLVPVAGGEVPAGNNTTSVAVDAQGRFVYAASHQSGGGVYGYGLDPVTGALTWISGSPFLTTLDATSVATDSTGGYLVVTDYAVGAGQVKTFPIAPATGTPGALIASVPALGPWDTALTPGNLLYTSFLDGGKVASLAVTSSGGLNPVTGGDQGACGTTPENNNCIATGSGPRGMAAGRISGSGSDYLFVANSGSSDVSLFSVGGSGALSNVNTAAAGATPWDIALDPSGNYAWVANHDDATLTAYTLDGVTGITRRTDLPATTPTGPFPFGLVLSPDGNHAWVGTRLANEAARTTTVAISGYSVAANGSLTPITSGTTAPAACGNSVRDPANCFATVDTNFSFQVTPDGAYLYTGYFVLDTLTFPFKYHSSIAAWKINADGTLSPITSGTTSPGSCAGVTPDNANCYSAGAGPILRVSPDGEFLYGVNSSGDDISVWKINADGTLTANDAAVGAVPCSAGNFLPVANPPANCYPAGPVPVVLNMQNDPYVYVVNLNPNAPDHQPQTISAWTRNTTTGALTAIAGAPCGNPAGETDPANCVYAGDGAVRLIVSPDKNYAYINNP